MTALLVLLVLTCSAGCTGQLLDALESRQVASCLWWRNPVTGFRGVTATGGMPLERCLAVPCMTHP